MVHLQAWRLLQCADMFRNICKARYLSVTFVESRWSLIEKDPWSVCKRAVPGELSDITRLACLNWTGIDGAWYLLIFPLLLGFAWCWLSQKAWLLVLVILQKFVCLAWAYQLWNRSQDALQIILHICIYHFCHKTMPRSSCASTNNSEKCIDYTQACGQPWFGSDLNTVLWIPARHLQDQPLVLWYDIMRWVFTIHSISQYSLS